MTVVHDKSQLSIRVPKEMILSFDKIAAAIERDRTWLMLRALEHYLEVGGGRDLIREAAGLEALDRGEGLEFDTVINEVDDMIAEAKARKSA